MFIQDIGERINTLPDEHTRARLRQCLGPLAAAINSRRDRDDEGLTLALATPSSSQVTSLSRVALDKLLAEIDTLAVPTNPDRLWGTVAGAIAGKSVKYVIAFAFGPLTVSERHVLLDDYSKRRARSEHPVVVVLAAGNRRKASGTMFVAALPPVLEATR